MSELAEKTNSFSSFLISNLILSCSCVLSHPLYFLYVIFFSPYLLRILSFLFPLFITTTLWIITLENFSTLSSMYHTNHTSFKEVQLKMTKDNNESHSVEALELFKILFDTSMIDFVESQVDGFEEYPEERVLQALESTVLKITHQDQDLLSCEKMEKIESLKQENKFEDLLKEIDEFESMKSVEEEQKANQANVNEANKTLVSKLEVTESFVKGKKFEPPVEEVNGEELFKYDIRSYGSMRREKEWKRTLACKLFEERNNGDGIEGMDSLWERYEMTSRTDLKKRDKSKRKIEYNEDCDDEDEESVGSFCCLQAFKFSARKMNLGVGKRNLGRISKAVKGIGLLCRVSKQDKKVHSGDKLQFA